jgi:predicted MFS family arabinose efflux permease
MVDGGTQPSAIVPLSRNRDFQLLWIGSVVSAVGSRVSSIAYPLLVLALTGSAADAGLVGFTATLPYLLFQLPAGALVDRWNRRRVMIACDVGRGLALASIVVAFYLDALSLWQIMIVSFAEGTLYVFYSLAEPAAVRNIVHPSQFPTALSQIEGRERGSQLLGQPLGGLLFDLGRAVPFLVDALTYVASLVALLLIKKEFQVERSDTRAALLAEIVTALRWVWHEPVIRATAVIVAGSNFLFQPFYLLLIVIAKAQGASGTDIGIMLIGSGIGGVIGALLAPWFERKLSMKAVVIGANWVWALLMPCVLVFDNLYVLGAIYGAMVFVGPVWNVATEVYRLRITPDNMLGRVASAMSLLAYGAIPLGSLIGGYLLETTGPAMTGLAIAVCMLIVAAGATISPAIRNAPSITATVPAEVKEPTAMQG